MGAMANPPASSILTASDRRLLQATRTATLATLDPHGRPRLVPCCYGVHPEQPRLWTPIDEKPKRSTDPRHLGRVTDLLAWPEVSLLVDRWSEDWSELAWVRLHGQATVLETDTPDDADERRTAIQALRARYPQYRQHDLESRPIIAIDITEAIRWAASET
jgi:PPOX class probable F420-dependent enzyme